MACKHSLAYISTTYGVPANIGQRVRVYDRLEGEIVGGYHAYIQVKIDGEKGTRIYHPTWMIEYLNVANSVAAQKRRADPVQHDAE